MDGKTIVSSIVVAILGLISTALGLVFEFLPMRSQGRLFHFRCNEFDCNECLYFRSAAFYMVVGAIVCVIVALLIISISAGCGCGRATSSSSCTKGLAILAFFLCWLVCLGAIVLFLLAGAEQYGVDISKIGDRDYLRWRGTDIKRCYEPRSGLFGGAGGASFIGVTLGIISFVALASEDKKIRRANRAGRAHPYSRVIHDQQHTSPTPANNDRVISPEIQA